MSQATLDDDELFEDAASEMREDVEASLEKARAALPDADEIWAVEADNTLGVLNALRSALDVGDAEDHLRDAKKWYTMGERADAFEDGDDLAEEVEAVAELLGDVETAHEQVSDLASTVPQLRSALEEFADDGGADAEADADADEAEA
jgi:phage shock protein A